MSGRSVCMALVIVVAQSSLSRAQVVHLPTFDSFSVGTSVVVPDGGAASLGGVSRGAWSSSTRGVPGLGQIPGVNRAFKNRSFASSVSSSQAYATVTIIDHAELDQRVLANAAAQRGAPLVMSDTERKAARLSQFVSRHADRSVAESRQPSKSPLADHRIRIAEAEQQLQAELAGYWHRAQEAEAAGRFGAARCCYDVVARRGLPEQKLAAQARLAALESRDAGLRVAAHAP